MNEYVLKEYRMKRQMADFALDKGYLPFEPSLFEDYDRFSALDHELKKEQLLTVVSGQQFQLLRPDITTAIMNRVLPNVKARSETKLFYQSTIYRMSETGIKGIRQFGIEYLGAKEVASDREVLDLAVAYLEGAPFVLEVGTTKFLSKLLELCQLDVQQEKVLRKLVYIKNKEELAKFGKVNGLPLDIQLILAEIFSFRGTYEDVLTKLRAFKVGTGLLDILHEVAYLQDLTGAQVIFDLSMSSELKYYDGVIFKGYYRKVPQAVLSGGRYAENAIGFSIAVDPWLGVQKEVDSPWNI